MFDRRKKTINEISYLQGQGHWWCMLKYCKKLWCSRWTAILKSK